MRGAPFCPQQWGRSSTRSLCPLLLPSPASRCAGLPVPPARPQSTKKGLFGPDPPRPALPLRPCGCAGGSSAPAGCCASAVQGQHLPAATPALGAPFSVMNAALLLGAGVPAAVRCINKPCSPCRGSQALGAAPAGEPGPVGAAWGPFGSSPVLLWAQLSLAAVVWCRAKRCGCRAGGSRGVLVGLQGCIWALCIPAGSSAAALPAWPGEEMGTLQRSRQQTFVSAPCSLKPLARVLANGITHIDSTNDSANDLSCALSPGGWGGGWRGSWVPPCGAGGSLPCPGDVFSGFLCCSPQRSVLLRSGPPPAPFLPCPAAARTLMCRESCSSCAGVCGRKAAQGTGCMVTPLGSRLPFQGVEQPRCSASPR